jgi:hypothetical protein
MIPSDEELQTIIDDEINCFPQFVKFARACRILKRALGLASYAEVEWRDNPEPDVVKDAVNMWINNAAKELGYSLEKQ